MRPPRKSSTSTPENRRLEVGGHTDSDEPEDYNLELSTRRAASVVGYLIEKGVDTSRLEWKGYGESRPIYPNTNEDQRKPIVGWEFRILDASTIKEVDAFSSPSWGTARQSESTGLRSGVRAARTSTCSSCGHTRPRRAQGSSAPILCLSTRHTQPTPNRSPTPFLHGRDPNKNRPNLRIFLNIKMPTAISSSFNQ